MDEDVAGCICLMHFCRETALGAEGAGRRQKVEVILSKE